jgi:aryl-alcohol dehydrogenase-like predicted oxidoreductase
MTMRYRFLGGTGVAVSELCLGAMTFGREADEDLSRRMLDSFVAAGGNFIDTANVYSQGGSEELLGRWLKGQSREDLVIATKVRWGMGNGPNREGLTRRHILAAVEASLRRLGTDHLDLYQVHGWDPATPLEQTLATLDSLVTSGKVRYLGVSNWAASQLQHALDLADARGWERFVCLQPLYNLLDRETEWELLPVSRAGGLGVIPWSPLRGGWLSGRYHRDMAGPPEGTRVKDAERNNWSETWAAYGTERTWQVLDELHAVAGETGRTPAQVALNWLLQQPGVTAPIVGARTWEQFEANLGATNWDLDPALVDRLTRASDRPLPYPFYTLAASGRTPG